MDSKRKLSEGDSESSQVSQSITSSCKKPRFLSTLSTTTNTIPFVHPGCIILQNIPESAFDDEPIDVKWLEQALGALNIHVERVIGVDPGLDAFSYGILQFEVGDAGLKQALVLEHCFQVKNKGRIEWNYETPREKEGLYLWAATEQDMMLVREHVKNVQIVEVSSECLEAARKEACGIGANFFEVIMQAMDFYEQKLIRA